MDELIGWSRDLSVEVGGHGVVSHTGSALLRLLADRVGLTGALSKSLRRRGFSPVHDRGRVLTDLAVVIADGGTGCVGSRRCATRMSCSGRWPRTRRVAGLHELGPQPAGPGRGRPGAGPAARVGAGGGPARAAATVAEWPTATSGRVVIRLDARIVVAHSDKEQAAPTFKGTWGHHR